MPGKLIQQIHNRLIKHNKTIAVAESCSGGQLCSLLTSLSGSSGYFMLGAVTYSNKAKEIVLGIPAKIIAKHGAVSEPVAILMAQNVRKKAHADFGLSITGIAGPTGASPAKPIGTVYICLSAKNKNICRKFNFPGNRAMVRKRSTQNALDLLYAHLPR